MTESELDELDRRCAVEIMGWEYRKQEAQLGEGYLMIDAEKKEALFRFIEGWQPTRNISHAWEVLEKSGNKFYIEVFSEMDKYRCVVWPRSGGFSVIGIAEAAPLAIVKAALAAVGGEK